MMSAPSVVRGLLLAAASTFLLGPVVSAQLCPNPNTDTFWKHDTIADVPVGSLPVGSAVITPLCTGEAAGSYFQLVPGQGPQFLKQVSIGYGHITEDPTFQAILNIEIFSGDVTFNPTNIVTMPPKVFDLMADTGLSFNVLSEGVSAFDLSPYNIVVEGNFVVAFRMVANVSFPGCQAAGIGSDANFLTDGPGFCEPGKSLLDERTVGWVDPADWWFDFFQPICPTFYAGNWVIRACTTDAGMWEDLGGGTTGINGPVTLVGSGPLTEGTFNPIALSNAAPSAAMLAWISLNPTPFMAIGGTVHAFPYNAQLFLSSNASGGFSAASAWPAGVPPGTEVYFQFLVEDASSIHGITMSNGVLGTTP
jgi:hypothetical protein